jgi:putative cardiolipin synthase
MATLKLLKKNGVKVKVMTNSYLSDDGDSEAVRNLTHSSSDELDELGSDDVEIYGYNGARPAGTQVDWAPRAAGTKWSVHSKSAVIDDHSIWIGTNNIDPRSDYQNIEGGVFVPHNPELAKQLKLSINANLKNSVRLSKDKTYHDCYEKLRGQNGELTRKIEDLQNMVFQYLY